MKSPYTFCFIVKLDNNGTLAYGDGFTMAENDIAARGEAYKMIEEKNPNHLGITLKVNPMPQFVIDAIKRYNS